MATFIMRGAVFSFLTLHFALSFQEAKDIHDETAKEVHVSLGSDLNQFEPLLNNLEENEGDGTHIESYNFLSEPESRAQSAAKHRLKRGVLSWFASYFQSDSGTTKETQINQKIEDLDQSTRERFSGEHLITTPKPGNREINNDEDSLPNKSNFFSKKPEMKSVKMHGTTREPRSTDSTAVTEFFKKVNPQSWLTTVSAFLHNGVDIEKLQNGKSKLSRTDRFDLSTPEYPPTHRGLTTEASLLKNHKPHKIRQHKHRPHKVKVSTTPPVLFESGEGASHQSVTEADSVDSLHRKSEKGPKLKETIPHTINQQETKLKGCKNCGSNNEPQVKTSLKSMTEEEVKIIRTNMVAELMAQKLRLNPQDLVGLSTNKSLDKLKLPMLPLAILDETRERNSLIKEEDDFYARDQEAIVTGVDMGKDCIGMRSTGCYDFKFNGEVKGEVESAELWLYKTHDRRDITEQTFIVYELERPRGSSFLSRRNLIAREGTSTKEGWVKLNVTQPVQRWLEKRRDGEMLAIRCKTCETHNYRAIFGTKHGYKPLLIIKYVDKYSKRTRRSQETCNPVTECCRRPLTVVFNEINLPIVMHPYNLSIGYCYGFCDGIDGFTFNHTAIRQRSARWTPNMTENMREQLKPCCVPLQLRDTSILTLENDVMVRKVLPNVIVHRCGCV